MSILQLELILEWFYMCITVLTLFLHMKCNTYNTFQIISYELLYLFSTMDSVKYSF